MPYKCPHCGTINDFLQMREIYIHYIAYTYQDGVLDYEGDSGELDEGEEEFPDEIEFRCESCEEVVGTSYSEAEALYVEDDREEEPEDDY